MATAEAIQEAFLEWEWEDTAAACQARDARATQLKEEGYDCTTETLYNILSGYRVFVLAAVKPEPVQVETAPREKGAPNLRQKRSDRPARNWEVR